jgi:hypothetical protein
MNSAPDSLAGLASGVNNAVARAAGLLWIAALPPITGLTGAAYTDPAQFRSSFAQVSWICAAAFGCAAALAAAFITGPDRPAQAPRTALIQTPVPHLACPVAFGLSPGTNPQTGQQPGERPLPCRRSSITRRPFCLLAQAYWVPLPDLSPGPDRRPGRLHR